MFLGERLPNMKYAFCAAGSPVSFARTNRGLFGRDRQSLPRNAGAQHSKERYRYWFWLQCSLLDSAEIS